MKVNGPKRTAYDKINLDKNGVTSTIQSNEQIQVPCQTD